MPKWVGFDMDECIGSVMPLYAFVSELTAGVPRDTMKHALYASERMRTTWLIRPAMYYACELLYTTFKQGGIYGAFIFSNNSSQKLVDFIAEYLNGWMARRFSDYNRPQIFKMAVCRGSPLRPHGSLEKSVMEIQRSLAGSGLPMLENYTDLMFFDDMVHVLAGEIPNYVQVKPYVNCCPLDRVVLALAECEKTVGAEKWESILTKARSYDTEDRQEGCSKIPPYEKDILADRHMFLNAFRSFLGDGFLKGGRRRTKTRRRRSRSKVRKNTLRH